MNLELEPLVSYTLFIIDHNWYCEDGNTIMRKFQVPSFSDVVAAVLKRLKCQYNAKMTRIPISTSHSDQSYIVIHGWTPGGTNH